jgi:hypothetical protein
MQESLPVYFIAIMHLRSVLKRVVSIAVIAVAIWNIKALTTTVLKLPSRDAIDIVNVERSWVPIRNQLSVEGYTIGDLGFITPESLRGEPQSSVEDARYVELTFAVIPLHLVRNKLDTRFVLADFTRARADLPPGLIPYVDPGNGLLLLKNTTKQ